MAQLFHLSGQTLVNGNGAPYALAKAYFYETGTTTPKTTYSNAGLTSANANPVVADANGRFGDIYLIAGRYKVVYATSADVAIDTLDPVDGTSQLISVASAPAATYPFLRYHNTTDGNVYRRNAANSAWINEGPVDSIGNAATVSEVLTGTSTSVVVTPDALAGLWQRGTDIASASTLSLPAGGGGVFTVTGTTGITGISSAQGGRPVKLRFAGALTLTHNATSFVLPGSANITTVAGDMVEFINDAAADVSGSNWRCSNYETADGRILLGATQAQQEAGSSTTIPITPGVQQFHPSAAKCWAQVTVAAGTPTMNVNWNMTSITDTNTGRILFTIATDFSTVNWAFNLGIQCTTSGSPANSTDPTVTHLETSGQAAGTAAARCIAINGSAVDPERWSFSGFGDQ